MNEEDDDFLWSCELLHPHDIAHNQDRQWIVPDSSQDLFVGRQAGPGDFLQTHILRSSLAPHLSNDEISVKVCEEHGQGVCDVIGGEVWEAALLLSAYLSLHRPDLTASDSSQQSPPPAILELGSGVGLPMLMLAHTRLQTEAGREGKTSSLTLTDYDVQLVQHLSVAIDSQFHTTDRSDVEDDLIDGDWEERNITSAKSSQGETKVEMQIAQLDWEVFTNPQADFDTLLHPALRNNSFDVIVGSALCYATYHAKCLAAVIAYYLRPESRCKEVVIVQIKDREGFQHLLALLSNNFDTIVTKLEEDVVSYAQLIQRSLSSSSAPIKHSQGQTLPTSTSSGGTSLHLYDYIFPSIKKFQTAKEEIHLHPRYKWQMVQTDPDSFVLLRIKKKA